MIIVFTLCLGLFNCQPIQTFESKEGDVDSIVEAKQRCNEQREKLDPEVDWAKCVRSSKNP